VHGNQDAISLPRSLRGALESILIASRFPSPNRVPVSVPRPGFRPPHCPRTGGRVPRPELRVRPRERALPHLRPADREDKDPRPDRPADVFLPELPAAAAAAKSAVTRANIPGQTEAKAIPHNVSMNLWGTAPESIKN